MNYFLENFLYLTKSVSGGVGSMCCDILFYCKLIKKKTTLGIKISKLRFLVSQASCQRNQSSKVPGYVSVPVYN